MSDMEDFESFLDSLATPKEYEAALEKIARRAREANSSLEEFQLRFRQFQALTQIMNDGSVWMPDDDGAHGEYKSNGKIDQEEDRAITFMMRRDLPTDVMDAMRDSFFLALHHQTTVHKRDDLAKGIHYELLMQDAAQHVAVLSDILPNIKLDKEAKLLLPAIASLNCIPQQNIRSIMEEGVQPKISRRGEDPSMQATSAQPLDYDLLEARMPIYHMLGLIFPEQEHGASRAGKLTAAQRDLIAGVLRVNYKNAPPTGTTDEKDVTIRRLHGEQRVYSKTIAYLGAAVQVSEVAQGAALRDQVMDRQAFETVRAYAELQRPGQAETLTREDAWRVYTLAAKQLRRAALDAEDIVSAYLGYIPPDEPATTARLNEQHASLMGDGKNLYYAKERLFRAMPTGPGSVISELFSYASRAKLAELEGEGTRPGTSRSRRPKA